MKKRMGLTLNFAVAIVMLFTVCMFTFTNPVYAFESDNYGYDYDNSGYYNETIYIQNQLDTFYHDLFETAIEYWDGYDSNGDKYLPGRSIVINNVSSSIIDNINFRGHEDYGVYNTDETYGLYIIEYTSTMNCTCHTTGRFSIHINDYFARYAREEDLLTENEILSTITHELGHMYGLIDFNENYFVYDSIMSYRINMNTMYEPQERDYLSAQNSWARHDD